MSDLAAILHLLFPCTHTDIYGSCKFAKSRPCNSNARTCRTHPESLCPPDPPPPSQRMRLRIKHPIIQTNPIRVIKNQIQILERFRQPKTLLFIRLIPPAGGSHVPYTGIAVGRTGCRRDMLEGLPGSVLVSFVSCYSVGVEVGFYSLWSPEEET